jgi:hypothetical protein
MINQPPDKHLSVVKTDDKNSVFVFCSALTSKCVNPSEKRVLLPVANMGRRYSTELVEFQHRKTELNGYTSINVLQAM